MILQHSSHTLAQHSVTEFPITIYTYHAIIDDKMIYFLLSDFRSEWGLC
jgi:hypothetical protein